MMHEKQKHKIEENYIRDESDTHKSSLLEINAQYIKFLKLEDTILKHKTHLQCLKEFDTNYELFHSVIRDRRRKLFVHKIVTEYWNWIQGEDNIAWADCEHLKIIFICQEKHINEHTWNAFQR